LPSTPRKVVHTLELLKLSRELLIHGCTASDAVDLKELRRKRPELAIEAIQMSKDEWEEGWQEDLEALAVIHCILNLSSLAH